MKRTSTLLTLALVLLSPLSVFAQVKAEFSADEAMTTYYSQGWDSVKAASSWKYTRTNKTNSWRFIKTSLYQGQQPFSSIDPTSKYSLSIKYDAKNYQDERATSPDIEVKPNSQVEYYALFCAVWLINANWTLSVIDVEKNDTTLLTNGFLWSQDNAFTGPSWLKFTYDLNKWAGKTCRFEFRYKGKEGDFVQIDGFKLRQKDTSAAATININQGDAVHFLDTSTGNPDHWTWTFEGGTPSTSTDQNPVVTYNQTGTHKVQLTVSNNSGASTAVREGFITVKALAPTALAALPTEAYLSPWVAAFLPTNTPVQFFDRSAGFPTSWSWTFEGGTPATSTEQNPTVTYANSGKYGYTFDVTNTVGTNHDFMVKAIQVGGSQDIWNIGLDEYSKLGTVSLGWYGNYGGSNWAGMTKFAEAFNKPLAPATIDSVAVYFDKTSTVSPNELITVSICLADAAGKPGTELASASVKASDLVYDKDKIVATKLVLNQPAKVNAPFFVVISGIPHNTTDGGSDDISILSVLRKEGGKTTTWHLLEEWDKDNKPTGKSDWFKNTDSPVSLAVTARLTFDNNTSTAISSVKAETPNVNMPTTIYSIDGARRQALTRGMNIIKTDKGSVKMLVK